MRFLGRCFAISLISGLLGLAAFAQTEDHTAIAAIRNTDVWRQLLFPVNDNHNSR
jgi:hypothetical protein